MRALIMHRAAGRRAMSFFRGVSSALSHFFHHRPQAAHYRRRDRYYTRAQRRHRQAVRAYRQDRYAIERYQAEKHRRRRRRRRQRRRRQKRQQRERYPCGHVYVDYERRHRREHYAHGRYRY